MAVLSLTLPSSSPPLPSPIAVSPTPPPPLLPSTSSKRLLYNLSKSEGTLLIDANGRAPSKRKGSRAHEHRGLQLLGPNANDDGIGQLNGPHFFQIALFLVRTWNAVNCSV
ncbi:hypothetical protein PsorP6_007018 [Peronosclerospora sorghi]|uniref:Uncharacterized protein n=1 Tax=Peronosclerospora sorghi TaxID=230839 RepID=A0ACC0WB20_9STRA|nr:hypothetical protein PsorP6_007018 [Peronosclerospora sorghi]